MKCNHLLLACSGLLGEKVLIKLFRTCTINAVLTDKFSFGIINFCKKNNINIFIGNARSNECYNFAVKYKNCILFSINYLFLFNSNMLDNFKQRFNIHGSLLPKYRGRAPHIWAIINNEKKTGITIHELTLECDAGDIYFQKEIPIKNSDTGGAILNKYIYHYPKIINQFLLFLSKQKIYPIKQNNNLSTYYEKRSPEDGKIVWDWQRERIYNWVRALAHPYPGAFCYYNNSKIIINRIKYSDFGYSNLVKNGTIISKENNLIVKTPNGCIEIFEYSSDDDISFSCNNYFI